MNKYWIFGTNNENSYIYGFDYFMFSANSIEEAEAKILENMKSRFHESKDHYQIIDVEKERKVKTIKNEKRLKKGWENRP